MKCPHCNKPVHVHLLSLGKGRTKFTMNPGLLNSVKASRKYLQVLINKMYELGHNQREVAKILGVTDGYMSQLTNKDLPCTKDVEI